MSQYFLIRHKVKNFETWKAVYDKHQPKRGEAGLTDKHVLRSASDSNEVVLLFEAKDLSRARAFSESTELRETMQAAGVVDKPDLYFLTE
jgi:hypothetical protein